jgi:acyl-coenzyme A synthetase/AMP-(fatty) acid ligase
MAVITSSFFPFLFIHRYDENGVLYYEGRLKDLIKYKARHLYPLEIEKILEEHPDILEAGVFGKPDPLVQVSNI